MRSWISISSSSVVPRHRLAVVAAVALLSGCPDGTPTPEPSPPAEPEQEPEDAGDAADGGNNPDPTDGGAPVDAGNALDGGVDAGTDAGPPPEVDAGPRDAPTLTAVASTLSAGALTIAVVGEDVDEDLRLIRVLARSDSSALLFDNSFPAPAVDRDGDAFRAFVRLDLGGLAVAQLSVTAIGSNGNLSETLASEVNPARPTGTACITRSESPPWTACDVDLGCLNASSFIGSCEVAPGERPVLSNVVAETVEAASPACTNEPGKNAVTYRATGTADLPIAFLQLADGAAPPQFVAAIANPAPPPPPNYNVSFVQCVVSIQEVDDETKDASAVDTAGRTSFVRPLVYGDYVAEPGDDWSCGELTFAGADGCHCGCGEPDPDCGGAVDLDTCEICDAPGSCSLDGECPGSILSTDVSQCIAPFCGDGEVNAPNEQCEPPLSDTCDQDCRIIVQTPAEACVEATVVMPGPNTSTTSGRPDVFAGSCGPANVSEDQVFVYTTTMANTFVLATVSSDVPADHALYARTTCDDENTELVCTDVRGPTAESIVLGPLPSASTVFLFVDSFREGSFSLEVEEFTPVILGDGETCVFGDLTATCDDSVIGLACLSVGGAFTCQTPTVLNPGDVCFPADTGAVCDDASGDVCRADGAGGNTCQNLAALVCETPTPLAAGLNTIATETNGLNVDASCFQAGNTAAFEYTVVGAGVSIVFDVDSTLPFDTGLSLRTTCLDSATTVDCTATGGTLPLISGPHAAGEVLSLFVGSDSASSYDLDLTVAEGFVTTLNLGDVCDPASPFVICDTAAGLVCRDDGPGFTCVDAARPNDTCVAPIVLTELVSPFAGNFLDASNNYNPQDYLDNCTGFRASGPDLVYEVALSAVQTLDVTYTVADGDASLYLLGTCAPGDTTCTCDDFSMQCVVGVDATLEGAAETLSFSPDADGIFFLILDAYNDTGPTDFELTYSIAP